MTLLPAGAVSVFILFKPAPLMNKDSGSSVDAYRLGTIVSDNGGMRCVHATFDNVTGSIAEGKTSCEATSIAPGGEPPTPIGTIRTLNAISNSFKK